VAIVAVEATIAPGGGSLPPLGENQFSYTTESANAGQILLVRWRFFFYGLSL
jgi:hypothetical protein